MAIWGLYNAAIALVVAAAVWLSQLLLPKDWRWLSPEDISHLQTILTAGVLVSIIGNHFKKRMGPSD